MQHKPVCVACSVARRMVAYTQETFLRLVPTAVSCHISNASLLHVQPQVCVDSNGGAIVCEHCLHSHCMIIFNMGSTQQHSACYANSSQQLPVQPGS